MSNFSSGDTVVADEWAEFIERRLLDGVECWICRYRIATDRIIMPGVGSSTVAGSVPEFKAFCGEMNGHQRRHHYHPCLYRYPGQVSDETSDRKFGSVTRSAPSSPFSFLNTLNGF